MGIHTTPELWVRKKCAVCALNDSQKWWPFKILNKRPNVVFNPIHNIIIYYTQSCFLVKTWRDRLTLAFPASDQFVPLLALAVVCTHLVDTAAPMTAWWIFTLVDIWREGNKNSARMWSMWWEAGALFFPRIGQGFTELFLCALNKSRWLKDCISLSALSECMVSCLHSGCPLVCAGILGSIGIWRSRQYWCSGR